MNLNITKIFLSAFVMLAVSVFAISVFPFPGGYVGTTKKNGGDLGCVCHGEHVPSPEISVFFTGPDSVETGQTATFTIKVSHGPAVTGGFNVASYSGVLDTVQGMGTKKDSASGELTHSSPKAFVNDTVSWSFSYTAPNTPQMDTLFATGNSTNNDNTSDSDKYNFSLNRLVRVYNPIGIINISLLAKDFSLSQNYPNPFNPATSINFSVGRQLNVAIKVYDILGNETAVIVNENLKQGQYSVDFDASGLSSGVYFYSMYANRQMLFTKKMLLIK
jgi:hypothetical protein